MEYKAQRRVLKVTIDGKVHDVRFPQLKEIREYAADIKKAEKDDEKASEIMTGFLSTLGLAKEAQELLEIEDLKNILGLLHDQKKS